MKTKLIILAALWPIALAAQTGTIYVDEDHTNHKITNLSHLIFSNTPAPSTPASGKTDVYVDSTSKNIAAKSDAGIVNHGIRSVVDASTQYVHGIDDDGTVHYSTFSGGSGGAPATDHFVTTRNDSTDLPNSFSLGSLSSGILYQTVSSSISTPAVVTIGSGLTFTGGTLSLTNTSITIAGTSTSLGGSISLDTITGLSTVGLVKRTGTNALTTVTAPSGAVVGDTDTQTLTNKRITARVTTITSSATPTINTDNTDAVTITALAVNITSFTTNLSGTPNNFDKLIIRIKDSGGPWTIAWGALFASSQSTLPVTTAANKVTSVGLIYDSVKAKWICLAVDQEP